MNTAYLLLGSNQGQREQHLKRAVREIGNRVGKIRKMSSVYETQPWGFEAEKYFLNQALSVETELSPIELLRTLLSIEQHMGRERGGEYYQSRDIDIDIIFYNEDVIDVAELKVPHPRMHIRKFTLVPMSEINGRFIHPVLRRPLEKLLDECNDPSEVEIYDNQE